MTYDRFWARSEYLIVSLLVRFGGIPGRSFDLPTWLNLITGSGEDGKNSVSQASGRVQNDSESETIGAGQ